MPNVKQEASIERNRKRRFERKLVVKLTDVWNKQVRAFVRSYNFFRMLPPMDVEQTKLENLLAEHYVLVGNRFGFRMRKAMPKDVRMSDVEKRVFNDRLTSQFVIRSVKQAELITRTTLKLMDRAIAVGIEAKTNDPNTNIAITAGQWLIQRNISRANVTACFETQWSAEIAKHFETTILLGELPEIKAKFKKKKIKRWDSVGDSRVRSHHLVADGIQVDFDKPYVVNGERLMYPGDTSLGASPDNVINCRCSSIVDVVSVATARQDLDTFREVSEILDLASTATAASDLLIAARPLPIIAPIPKITLVPTPKPKPIQIPFVKKPVKKPKVTVQPVEDRQLTNAKRLVDDMTFIRSGTNEVWAKGMMDHVAANIPIKVLQKIKTSINLGETIETIFTKAEIASIYGRGRLAVVGSEGLYSKRIGVNVSRKVKRANGELRISDRSQGVLAHEIGHALDFDLDKVSQSGFNIRANQESVAKFKEAFRADVSQMNTDTLVKLNYYTFDPAEAFAESFSHVYSNGSSFGNNTLFKKSFKRTMKVVKEIVEAIE